MRLKFGSILANDQWLRFSIFQFYGNRAIFVTNSAGVGQSGTWQLHDTSMANPLLGLDPMLDFWAVAFQMLRVVFNILICLILNGICSLLSMLSVVLGPVEAKTAIPSFDSEVMYTCQASTFWMTPLKLKCSRPMSTVQRTWKGASFVSNARTGKSLATGRRLLGIFGHHWNDEWEEERNCIMTKPVTKVDSL